MVNDACAICTKFRGEGPLAGPWIWQDALVRVSHMLPEPVATLALGHLIIDTRRHAVYLDGLTDQEAAAVGRAARDGAQAMRAELDPEFVHAAVVNTSWEHFHQHVYVRHRQSTRHCRRTTLVIRATSCGIPGAAPDLSRARVGRAGDLLHGSRRRDPAPTESGKR
jgi:diadenosine tetraphosphate (Ap4A) HIT family hydrolase